jgi:hypothetical protein
MAPQPQFAQAPVPGSSSGSVSLLAASYLSNTVKGNTLIVVFANGNANNPTAPITDSLSLKWFKAAQIANGTTFESEIWYAPNTVGGADTVTVTPGGTNASIAMMIYEVPGLVYPAAGSSPSGGQSLDQVTSNTSTGGTSPSVSIIPIVPNEYVFVGFALGTAAQTINVAAPFNNDTCPTSAGCSNQNPGSPAGLFSFVSASLFKPDMAASSPSATATSEPWAVAVASFKTLTVPVQGSLQGLGSAGTPVGGVVSVQGVSGATPIPINLARLNGTALGAPSNYGTSPGAVEVSGVNAFVTNTPSVDLLGNTGLVLDASVGAGLPPQNGLAILGQYNTTLPTPAAGNTVALQLDSKGSLYVNTEGRKATYEASQNSKTSIAGVSFFIQGSSTKTVRLTRIRVTYISTSGTVAYHVVTLQRYTTISGGTNTSVTPGLLDTANATPTAAVDWVSAVNTTQTPTGGVLRAEEGVALSSTAAAATSGVAVVDWVFPASAGSSQDLVLRGTGDYIGVVFDAATAMYNFWLEWTEE